MQYPKQDLVL